LYFTYRCICYCSLLSLAVSLSSRHNFFFSKKHFFESCFFTRLSNSSSWACLIQKGMKQWTAQAEVSEVKKYVSLYRQEIKAILCSCSGKLIGEWCGWLMPKQ
jgi:hypothetical protein